MLRLGKVVDLFSIFCIVEYCIPVAASTSLNDRPSCFLFLIIVLMNSVCLYFIYKIVSAKIQKIFPEKNKIKFGGMKTISIFVSTKQNTNEMKILIACEESQAVCMAFRRKGHEAYSCDIVDCSGGHPEWHLKQDVTGLLVEYWDMVIAFPPCTHLAVSGARHFERKRKEGIQQPAIDFFMLFANCKANKCCIENPVGIMSTLFRPPDQIINPWQFGHSVNKKTCLWLKGLPLLATTDIVPTDEQIIINGTKRMSKWYYDTSLLPHKDRAKARSKTFTGIAKAMAEQWG